MSARFPPRAQASLASLMSSPKPPAELADDLDAALPLATVDAALAIMQPAVSIRSSIQDLDLAAISTALQAAQDSLSSAQTQLESVSASMDSYLATYSPAGGMPPTMWQSLVDAVQAAGDAVQGAADQVPSTTNVFNQACHCCALLAYGLEIASSVWK